MIDRTTIETALGKKQRSKARVLARGMDPENPLDTVSRAVRMAEIIGAIDILEEILHDDTP